MDQKQRMECGDLVKDEVTPKRQAREPYWLEVLLNDKFFKSCAAHKELRKNETNIFCIECVKRICHHCLPRHAHHATLQVRKYVYHDVVRLRDIQKYFDCSHVQPYSINGSKAVFLNARPQTKPPKPLGSECVSCSRSLQAPYRYCSVACKVSNPTPSPPPEKECPDVKKDYPDVKKECPDVKYEEVTNDIDVKRRKSRRKGIPYRSPLR